MYSISAEVRDNATNRTAHTFQIGYDITPPQTSATLTETEDGMVVTLNRWDGVSGYALTRVAINGVWQDYHAPITISEKGEYWVQYFSTDFAGNIEAEKITSFTIADEGVVITQNPPVVNIVPPSNPPNTPPFETSDDFPPNLGDETIFYVSPPPPPVIISTPPTFLDDNRISNNGDGVHTTNTNTTTLSDNPRISRPPVIREGGEGESFSDVFPLEAHTPPQKNPVRVSPIEYVEHPVVFEPTESTVISDPPAEASDGIDVPENAPLDVTMLAMLGLTIAGAGIMKSESAIAKQKEQDAKKANDLAVLQAQQDAQKADASANWEENLAMQAEAGQDVIVAVKQSQANKNYWAAYAIWLAGVAEANARKLAKAKEQFKLYIETNFKQLALMLGMSVLLGLLSLVSPSQNSSSIPVGEHPKWDEYVQSYNNLLSHLPEKSCFDVLPGGGGVAVLRNESCAGGGGGILTLLFWLYWQLTKANVDVKTNTQVLESTTNPPVFDWDTQTQTVIATLIVDLVDPIILYRGVSMDRAYEQLGFHSKLWLTRDLSYATIYAHSDASSRRDTSAILIYATSQKVQNFFCHTGHIVPCGTLEYGYTTPALASLIGPIVVPIPDTFNGNN